MDEGWGRSYSDDHKLYYLHKKDEDSIWEIDLDKVSVIEKTHVLPSYNRIQNSPNTKDTCLAENFKKLILI